ncbi:MAG: 1-deoxy-D-xylulose-5-phosphate synthase [Clostridia bacterium]|nr:1-deoxy-D-xylulose-5-phosphate synthase [Clostridia bacterium]
MSGILERVDEPADLKGLTDFETRQLAAELRAHMVDTLSNTGGHLAPSLGVVELTLAIHMALDAPRDKIIWDVGHQSYVHKLLTGRREAFSSIRQEGGISGFPRRDESIYDPFGTGHSSTSISAALGMAIARDLAGENYTVLAVIGDGALGGGMALEAMNHAGHAGTDLIVVLNDNEMSISKSVGGLASYLGSLRANPKIRRLKSGLEQALLSIPLIGPILSRSAHAVKQSVKQLVLSGMFFEELGFMYIGPIDGHNVKAVRRAIEDAKQARGPVLIHAITVKGKGYAPAEANPSRFHGTGPFVVATGEQRIEPVRSFTSHFGEAMVRAADRDQRIIGITAAMTDGTGLRDFARTYPKRFHDVGIAEEHAVTFAAGLAASGLRPVVAIYSTFLQRAYDQIIHDVALQKLPVLFAVDRAGVVGEDGYTHQGAFDVAFLRSIPGMVVMAPKDEQELAAMLHTGLALPGPCAIRYPRSPGRGLEVNYPLSAMGIGRAEVLREGADCAVFALGPMVWQALEASRILSMHGVNCAVVNARFAKPIDSDMLVRFARLTRAIITCEDGCAMGGYGSGVLEALAAEDIAGLQVSTMGLPDRFVEHGSRDSILASLGLDARGIASVAEAMVQSRAAMAAAGGSYASPK